MIFPLGVLYKIDVRNVSGEEEFASISNRKDSFRICFAEGDDNRKFLQREDVF